MAKVPFTIKPYKHPTLKYVVRSKEDGKWVRKFFTSLSEAKTHVSLKTTDLLNGGMEAVAFPAWLRVMAQQAQAQLDPFGKTIADAVKYYLPHIEAQATSHPIQKVVTELLAVKNGTVPPTAM